LLFQSKNAVVVVVAFGEKKIILQFQDLPVEKAIIKLHKRALQK